MKRVCLFAAQMGDLLCRRLANVALEIFEALELLHAAQNSILRYSRLPVCATSGGGVENVLRSTFVVQCSLFDVSLSLFNSWKTLTPALSHPMGEGDIDQALGLFPKRPLHSIATTGFSDLRKSDADTNRIHGNNSSNLQSSSDGSEPPSLPWFRTWRGVYVFVGACFVLYVVLLTVLSRAFS